MRNNVKYMQIVYYLCRIIYDMSTKLYSGKEMHIKKYIDKINKIIGVDCKKDIDKILADVLAYGKTSEAFDMKIRVNEYYRFNSFL